MKLVHGHPNLRKGSNGVLHNVSDNERRAYRQSKKMALQQQESQGEIQDLKSELHEVKELLKQLLQK
jgi:hypothetical protein